METWVPVIGYEDCYIVSNHGNIKSIDRFVNSKNNSVAFKKGKTIAKVLSENGYVFVHLSSMGKAKLYYLHRIVYASFFGEIGKDKTINHKNGIKTDNRIENLESVTIQENISHAVKTKLRIDQRQHNNNAVLTENNVKEIKKLLSSGFMSCKQIGNIFGVQGPAIWKIKTGRTWSD